MREESAISIFRKLPETKEQVSKYASLVKSSLLEGEVDPLLFAQQLKAFGDLLKKLSEDVLVRDCILQEAEKYGKSFKKGTASFCIKESGVTYDYTTCQDEEYEGIIEKFNYLQLRKKEREEFLKSIKAGNEIYGKDGRQLEPPVKRSTTSVTVTLD